MEQPNEQPPVEETQSTPDRPALTPHELGANMPDFGQVLDGYKAETRVHEIVITLLKPMAARAQEDRAVMSELVRALERMQTDH